MSNYKYGITPAELKEARKFIIQDIKSNNEVVNPIYNMTLQDYFNIIKEFMLGLCDENGLVIDPYFGTWSSYKYSRDLRTLTSEQIARDWMDGRGLFTEHFNGQLYGNKKHYGNWPNIDAHEENQWYHEDRLNDPLWFKECISVIGHAGHPTETLKAGNFDPVEYEENKWYLEFGTFSRSNWGCLKGYLYMKKKGLPVFIYAAQEYLTNKQIKDLKKDGFLIEKNYSTGYMVELD